MARVGAATIVGSSELRSGTGIRFASAQALEGPHEVRRDRFGRGKACLSDLDARKPARSASDSARSSSLPRSNKCTAPRPIGPSSSRRVVPGISDRSARHIEEFQAAYEHPVALLGALQLLEGYPPSVKLVDELVARTGLPADGFRSMHEHADLDIIHRDEIHRLLDTLPLTPPQGTSIGISALQTVDLLGRAFSEVFKRCAESDRR
jgi:hypothetical protein